MRDPYTVLGVSPNASDEDIKKPITALQGNAIRICIPVIKLRQRA